jgi:lysyl-tRNA synthetase, class I
VSSSLSLVRRSCGDKRGGGPAGNEGEDDQIVAAHTEADWVSRLADDVIAEAERRAPGRPIICASGLSPSGPIHLGNLREILIPHFVADEIRRRGHSAMHILSWDDYDRFRKVPAGIDAIWAQHIGKPLTSVPAPVGSHYPNWAEHFKAPMLSALAKLGVEVHGISQTTRYTGGAYREQILLAMRERAHIDAILAPHRTKARAAVGWRPHTSPRVTDAAEAVAVAAAGSGAATEDDGATATGYFPYRPYCSVCERDETTVISYDDHTTELSYVCRCAHAETVRLFEHNRGKLVWKVDWPMRWAYEGVVFEPSGVDHTSPGSSFTVGSRIIREVLGQEPPIGPMYAFVGITGMAKMSSSRGAVPTPADALEVMEAPVLRWLYVRRRPNQSFKVAFDHAIFRLYDEWDSLSRRAADGSATAVEAAAYRRSASTAATWLPTTPRPVSYRMLTSILDITGGHQEQSLRILGDLDPDNPIETLDETRPRLDCAQAWVDTQMPPARRTRVRDEPDLDLLASLGDVERKLLRLFRDGLDRYWSLEGLTRLVYGVPKLSAGLPLDAPPTAELKVAQREFFSLLYRLLVGTDTGPRLPTLLLAIGADRVRKLLEA